MFKAKEEPKLTFRQILDNSAASAMRGGTAGALAMGANVAALMWIRTTVRTSLPLISRNVVRTTTFHHSLIFVLQFYYILFMSAHRSTTNTATAQVSPSPSERCTPTAAFRASTAVSCRPSFRDPSRVSETRPPTRAFSPSSTAWTRPRTGRWASKPLRRRRRRASFALPLCPLIRPRRCVLLRRCACLC